MKFKRQYYLLVWLSLIPLFVGQSMWLWALLPFLYTGKHGALYEAIARGINVSISFTLLMAWGYEKTAKPEASPPLQRVLTNGKSWKAFGCISLFIAVVSLTSNLFWHSFTIAGIVGYSFFLPLLAFNWMNVSEIALRKAAGKKIEYEEPPAPSVLPY